MRLIDADALKEDLKQYFSDGTLDSVSAKLAFNIILRKIDEVPTVSEITKEKLSVAYDQGYEDGKNNWLQEERPHGEWVRKEDIIRYIATQYSEHNELVPIWLSIGDLEGGAE